MDREFGVGRCKRLHIEWINNKVLLYSTVNNIQYPEINHNGKEYLKKCISLRTTTTEACTPRAQDLQQEKPLQ